MNNSFRAWLAVALLAGFPLLVLLVIAAIVAIELYALREGPVAALRVGIVAVPALVVLIRALLTIEQSRGDADPGLALTPEDQPELWALVRKIADEVGTRPPDEIRIIPQVNAAVHERTRWLGLRVSRRRLYIGAQLFAGLRQDQLCAVLGHEFAHYSNRDTRFSGATYRGRQAIAHVVTGLADGNTFARILRGGFQGYAKLYFTVSMRVCRTQELAADAAAARVGGTAAAVGALREIEALDVAWRFFLNTYAMIGWAAGYLPARLAEGYRALLADPIRSMEIDEVRRNPPDGKTSRYDSHPATLERIRLLESAPVAPPRPGGERPASEILRHSFETLDAALLTGLSDQAQMKRRTDWQTLVYLGSRHDVAEAAAKILGGRTVGEALALLDAAQFEPLADPDLTFPPGAGPRARRELLAGSVRTRLSIVARVAFADAGVARWLLSWSGPAEFVLEEPYHNALGSALDAATAGRPDTKPLRDLFAHAGIAPGYRPTDPVPVRS
ncbi:M48 family metalloprotease [Amycolatopsis cynarae]|uniref:M48 family metalloprotease n=1 Tax=Amycolatopsis cynarae TaxID=2995223 RepID=A0ABY7BC66_9PSEU|nr:M48 family metallopeptidase [Amycolatopsis sp. HUAS 11-8]WAL68728.1 M48 family metalloprotease [Amycolatopsis sp. HUAS 11-8]